MTRTDSQRVLWRNSGRRSSVPSKNFCAEGLRWIDGHHEDLPRTCVLRTTLDLCIDGRTLSDYTPSLRTHFSRTHNVICISLSNAVVLYKHTIYTFNGNNSLHNVVACEREQVSGVWAVPGSLTRRTRVALNFDLVRQLSLLAGS